MASVYIDKTIAKLLRNDFAWGTNPLHAVCINLAASGEITDSNVEFANSLSAAMIGTPVDVSGQTSLTSGEIQVTPIGVGVLPAGPMPTPFCFTSTRVISRRAQC